MTTHGIRATMISLLISAGYSDAAVVLNCSLQSYHNPRGKNCEDQLAFVFGGAAAPTKSEEMMDIGDVKSGRLIHGNDGGRAAHMHEKEVGGGVNREG